MTCKQCTANISALQNKEAKNCGLCVDCFDKPFSITSICRADLYEYAEKSDIGELDDGDMDYLARKMADAYMNVFWIDLEILLDSILENKKNAKKS